jgi:hypothetical protein
MLGLGACNDTNVAIQRLVYKDTLAQKVTIKKRVYRIENTYKKALNKKNRNNHSSQKQKKVTNAV